MKKKIVIFIIMLFPIIFAGCGRQENEERQPIPTLETAPPHSIPTYTATTVEFYSAETRSQPRYGTFPAPEGFPEADTAIAFPDFAGITADFGADTAAVNADTMDGAAGNIYVAPDTADTRY